MRRQFFIACFPILALAWVFIASFNVSIFEPNATSGPAELQEKAEAKKKPAEPTISPVLEDVTIEVAERRVKPVSVSDSNLSAYAAGDLRLRIKNGVVEAFKIGQAEPHWRANAPAKVHLTWLAADAKTIYLAGFKVDEKGRDDEPENPARVRRIEASTGKWLDELVIAEKKDAKKSMIIQSVMLGNAEVVVLSSTADDDKGFEGVGQLVGYRVSCFKGSEVRARWSKEFSSAGKTGRDGAALLWSARAPEQVRPDLQHLTRLGDDILICAGPTQDLICLERDTGKQRWRVERVWEYKRSFIGPSVWQHFFARSEGEADDDGKKDKKAQKEKERPPQRQYSIVGGPIVVPTGKAGEGEHSIFLAVSKGPAQYASYLSDCVVYEFGSDGRPLSMANLPRMVRGGWFRQQKDGIVWACQGNSFVKLGVSKVRQRGFGDGPGGPDLLCRVDWHRQLSADQPDAWLTSNTAGSPITFTDTHAFRVIAGGHVLEPTSTVYSFPVSVVDLKSGVDSALVLNVPFKGKVPEPHSNYSRSQSPQGKDRWQASGPYLLAITWLKVEGNRLHVTLGMQEWTRTLSFEIDDLTRRKRE